MALTQFDAPGFRRRPGRPPEREHGAIGSPSSSPKRATATEAATASRTSVRGCSSSIRLAHPPGADAAQQGHRLAGIPAARAAEVDQRQTAVAHGRQQPDQQDEYCEWSVTRDPDTDKITRVTFTSEGPEYWQFLAAVAPTRVVALYREHIRFDGEAGRSLPQRAVRSAEPLEQLDDQRRHALDSAQQHAWRGDRAGGGGDDRPRGPRGTGHRCAAAHRRAGSTVRPQRHSDPHIGAVVNELARSEGGHHAGESSRTLHRRPLGRRVDHAGWFEPARLLEDHPRHEREGVARRVRSPRGQGFRRRGYQDQWEAHRVRRADRRLHHHQADGPGDTHRHQHRAASAWLRAVGGPCGGRADR